MSMVQFCANHSPTFLTYIDNICPYFHLFTACPPDPGTLGAKFLYVACTHQMVNGSFNTDITANLKTDSP